MSHWYVIKTKPKKEKDVQNLLARASFETFLPTMKAVGVSSENHSTLKPLFPSYLFIHTDFKDPYTHRMIRFTRGVSKILGDKEGPHTIAQEIVETLQKVTRDGSLIEQELLFQEGDKVRVKKGIMKDLLGIIEKNVPESGRVKILFKWISGSMRATLRYKDLEKMT